MTTQPLKDKTFVFTGEMKIDRDDAKSKVIMLGGRCTTAPSSKTTYLVTGSEPGESKLKKAKEIGIKILTETEFNEMIKKASSSFDDTTIVNTRKEEKGMCKEEKTHKYLWSEKYRPTSKSELVGNPGIIKQLEDFLKKKTDLNAALLSGPPGIGKTTLAHLICKSLQFDIIEFNASDVRSKTELNNKISGLINNYSIGKETKIKKKVLIMDEIDGMTSDRGGLVELTSIIKNSKLPIICICNDRNNIKIRTLSNYCLDLRFRKPDSRQVFQRIKYILQKEGKQVPDSLINELILAGNCDMRYILNNIQNLAMRKSLSSNESNVLVKKDVMKNIFDVAVEIFQRKSVNEKIDLYFEDYSIIPLFVSENYLKLQYRSIKDLYESSDSISFGDIVEKYIRGSNQEWGLAPLHAVYSCAIPTHKKILAKRMDFPGWLGQNSKYGKCKRLIKTIIHHSAVKIKSDARGIREFSIELIFKHLLNFLKEGNVEKAINILKAYDMTKNDIQRIIDILPNGTEKYKAVKPKVKAELTRTYKKLKRNLPYLDSDDEKVTKAELSEEDNEDNEF